MLAIRRVALTCRAQVRSLWTARICCGKSDFGGYPEICIVDFFEKQERPFNRLLSSARFYSSAFNRSRSYAKFRSLSSEAGAYNGGLQDDDLENGFSELEASHDLAEEATPDDEKYDGSFKPGVSDADDASQELIRDMECTADGVDIPEKKSPKTFFTSALSMAIFAAPANSVSSVLYKWVEEGKEVTQFDVSSSMLDLRNRRMYGRALQLSEWLESRKLLEFSQRNYASRVDLISKVRGIREAEKYIKHIPESFKAEAYHTLLANCVSSNDVKKSEEVFQKLRELISPITSAACNQMLILYNRVDQRKIANLLLLMDKENVKPDLSTYQILIKFKGRSNDITGMEQIVEVMKSNGLKPNTEIQALLARYYVAGGRNSKAEELLKEIEGEDLMKHRQDCCLLLPIYASLGRDDEVVRIWKLCESEARSNECLVAIEAWGKLNKVENAEAAFEKTLEKRKRLPARHVSALLKVYADHKMITKGKDLIKRMTEEDQKIGALELDGLVKLFIAAGEVEKLESIIEKASKEKWGKPFFGTLMLIMDTYAQSGDTHNTEKTFLMMKQAGYPSVARQYQLLLDAYINAKSPVYGFMDRMRGDNMSPSRALTSRFAEADPFRKPGLADLLE